MRVVLTHAFVELHHDTALVRFMRSAANPVSSVEELQQQLEAKMFFLTIFFVRHGREVRGLDIQLIVFLGWPFGRISSPLRGRWSDLTGITPVLGACDAKVRLHLVPW